MLLSDGYGVVIGTPESHYEDPPDNLGQRLHWHINVDTPKGQCDRILKFRGMKWYVSLVVCLLAITCWGLASASEVVVQRHAVIRDGPRGSARRLDTAEPGERFDSGSEADTNNWSSIEYQGDNAWIYSRWVDIVPDQIATDIRIASFNVLHLGWDNDKNLTWLSSILLEYDIIALQEVMYEDAMDSVLAVLDPMSIGQFGAGATWDFRVSQPIGRNSYREGYAFLWREDRVAIIPGSERLVGDPQDLFAREPYVASFRAGNFDFTLITVHFPFDSTERRNEAQAIDNVFEAVQALDPAENDVLLMGDFNLSSSNNAWNELKQFAGLTWILNLPTRTSIGTSGMANLYDNIWFQSQFLTEYSGQSGTNEFMHDLFEDDVYFNARDYVSDHVPVFAEFRTTGIDDD